VKRALPVLLPYAVFAALALVSWNRWIEPYVDSGRELMVPWRLSRGEALYRDVRFYYGPLAPVVAAGTEAAAGRSLAARIALAALVALAHIEALRRLANRLLTPARAALAASLAVALFFFLRPGGCHLFPYSLDTAIAVAAAAWTLVLAPTASRLLSVALLAALLSRPETGIAASLAALIPLLRAASPADRGRRITLVLVPVVAAAAVYALFSIGTPLATLRQEGWLAFLFLPPEFRRVYGSYSGIDRPALRLAELALAAIVLALVAVWLVTVAFLASRVAGGRKGRAATVGGIAVLAVLSASALFPPARLADSVSLFPPLIRPLPLAIALAAIWRVIAKLRRREDRGVFGGVPDEVLFLSVVFSSRLLLTAGYTGPYASFYLPLAAVAATAGLWEWVTREERSSGLALLPGLATGAVAVLLAFRIASISTIFRRPGWSRVQTPAGPVIVPQPIASATAPAIAEISRVTPENGTLAGFPEAGFLQYVLGRRNPLPQDQFFPGHLDPRAEKEAVALLEARPPDAFVYVNVLTIGHGAERFGSDYLRELDAAVRRLSRPVASFGPGAGPQARIGDPDFFIQVRVPARSP
jgi:hypothetical protein